MCVLGFPAHPVYPVSSATCIGCGDDPFGNGLSGHTASLKDTPSVFKVANVERELPLDQINPEDDETWSWTDTAKFYGDANGRISRKWNAMPTASPWDSSTTTMRFPSRTAWTARNGGRLQRDTPRSRSVR